jgi:hypothetical protein
VKVKKGYNVVTGRLNSRVRLLDFSSGLLLPGAVIRPNPDPSAIHTAIV